MQTWAFQIKMSYQGTHPVVGLLGRMVVLFLVMYLVIAALFTIIRTWKQPKCPSTDEWIKKMWHIYTMEYYSAIKRNEMKLSYLQ